MVDDDVMHHQNVAYRLRIQTGQGAHVEHKSFRLSVTPGRIPDRQNFRVGVRESIPEHLANVGSHHAELCLCSDYPVVAVDGIPEVRRQVEPPASQVISPSIRPGGSKPGAAQPTNLPDSERKVNMRQHAFWVAALGFTLVVLALASTAMAGYLKGDPRVCALSPTPSVVCAILSAHETAVARMKAYTHNPTWALSTHCRKTGPTAFKWRCSFSGGHVNVWFRAQTSGAWVRQTTVVMNS
jgi:hypothetical protein